MPQSFAELLRNSRSSPVSVVHKFLVNYDPNGCQIHAFVEGTPDLAFYRTFLEQYTTADKLRMYNCEGKARVYEAFRKVTERFPQVHRVLFFVDKDVDDITGEPWPIDSRIYVTEVYSIENYLVSKEVALRYLFDFVKVKRVEFEFSVVLEHIDLQLQKLYQILLPVMAWIVILRRSGQRPNLANINLSECVFVGERGVRRRKGKGILEYLQRVTGIVSPPGIWRQIRRTAVELRRLSPKRFIRGKFEAWFMIEYLKRLIADLDAEAKRAGGSISINAQLYESNFAQILVRGLPIPRALDSFLAFHLRPPKTPTNGQPSVMLRAWRRVTRLLGIR